MTTMKSNQNSSPNAILSKMFQKICHTRGMTPDNFSALLERYIIRANLPRSLRDVSSVRGNLKKELLKETMSWKVFIKGLCFLNVSRFDFVIRIHWGGIKTRSEEFTISVDVDQNQKFGPDDKDDD